MRVAVNDISFLMGFKGAYEARKALIKFANVALCLKDERVSGVDAAIDIVNSYKVNKSLELAAQYTLIQALNDIKSENMEQYLCILQILTMVGEEAEDSLEEFDLFGYRSRHCARHRKDFLLSIISDEIFAKETVQGTLNEKEYCEIRNIADEKHIGLYWEELGFRLYELNPKHGMREYVRAGGEKVGIAPESDELGQDLLNRATEK